MKQQLMTLSTNIILLLSVKTGYGCIPAFFEILEDLFPPLIETTTTTTTTTVATPTYTTEDTCTCGEKFSDGNRIVGGAAADDKEFPWQVALCNVGSTQPFCGGTILTSKTILTAAHCKTDTSLFKVVVGEHSISDEFDGQSRLSPKTWEDHPDYNENTYDNDYAIITLDDNDEITWTDRVQPICLPDKDNDYAGVMATVTGWGTLSSGGSSPDVLQKVSVDTQSNADCVANSGYSSAGYDITDNMMCAASDGKDSCQGDSGGPMIAENTNTDRYVLIGVVSWGIGCAQANYPGVYARVTAKYDWIEGKMTGSTCAA